MAGSFMKESGWRSNTRVVDGSLSEQKAIHLSMNSRLMISGKEVNANGEQSIRQITDSQWILPKLQEDK